MKNIPLFNEYGRISQVVTEQRLALMKKEEAKKESKRKISKKSRKVNR